MPTQNDQSREHYAECAYHNARVFEEAVESCPEGVDREGLREALRPLVDEWNRAGGFLPIERVDQVRSAVLRYAKKAP